MLNCDEKVFEEWHRFILLPLFVLILVAFEVSCALEPSRITDQPPRPPRLTSLEARDGRTLLLEFDLPLLQAEFSLLDDDGLLGNSQVLWDQNLLIIDWTHQATPGQLYRFLVRAEAMEGGVMSYQGNWRSPNLNPAQIQLNEVNLAGSSTRPDWIELKVIEKGNLGGLELLTGQGAKINTYRFPALEVNRGDFVLVHYKLTGHEGEVDELKTKDSALGPETSALAWDLWAHEAPGLVATKGMVALVGQDLLAYDNKGLGLPENTPEASNWFGIPLNPTGITATRTLIRLKNGVLPARALDWGIGASGKSSPGQENTSELFRAPSSP